MRTLVLAAGLLLALACLTAPKNLGAPDILERMGRTYAQCETYADLGVVTTVFFQERDGREYERTVRKPFTTAFARPDRFRYEFEDRRGEAEFDRFLVWRRGADVRTWWDIQPGVETHASVKPALSGATGVSGGTANQVPTLLMPSEVGWNALTRLEDPKRIDDALARRSPARNSLASANSTI